MANRKLAWRIGLIVVIGLLMTACNLGQQAPSEPVEGNIIPEEGVVQPQEQPAEEIVPTSTPLIEIPPTNTPVPELLPWEKLGPINVSGTDHRTQESVTVKVTRGKSVSNVTCSWVLQDTGQTSPLGESTSTQIDDNTFEEVYTFTPEAAGTYSVNCTGIATTATGPRAVNAAGTPFAVEAKG